MAKVLFKGHDHQNCEYCGARLRKGEYRVCSACRGGVTVATRNGRIDGEALLFLARRHQEAGLPPLEGMRMEEINAIARIYSGTAFNSYGRLREYCRQTGKLPPMGGDGHGMP